MGSQIKDKEALRTKDKTKEPEEFKVILLNDDYTTMEFVVEILVDIFRKSTDDAFRIMLDVHHKGKGIVGVYTWDIAVTKVEQVHAQARANEFPLLCAIEPV